MNRADPDIELQFSQPIRPILTMIIIIGLVGTGAWAAHQPILTVILSNIWLNSVIVGVFILGVVTCFWQVLSLISSVNWIEGFAQDRAGHEYVRTPRLLVSLATLLKSRKTRMQISASSSRSILDSMATRLDEAREITRYITNLLIFLGLLGTFYGLATTVPAVVDTIRSLAPAEGESGVAVFGKLMSGLESQLGGMGTAFSSSLLGLAGSLVVGLLDLFASHAQNRFYRELEEWLSTITQVGFSSGDGEGGAIDADGLQVAFHRMAESLDALQHSYRQTETVQSSAADHFAELTHALAGLGKEIGDMPRPEFDTSVFEALRGDLARIAEGQDRLHEGLGQIAAPADSGGDVEARMRLKSMDIQLLRINEEIQASRVEATEVARQNAEVLRKEISKLGRKPPSVGRG